MTKVALLVREGGQLASAPPSEGLQPIVLYSMIRRLYAARIAADYQRRTVDESIAREVMRDAAHLFRQLGVEHD